MEVRSGSVALSRLSRGYEISFIKSSCHVSIDQAETGTRESSQVGKVCIPSCVIFSARMHILRWSRQGTTEQSRRSFGLGRNYVWGFVEDGVRSFG